jgi:nucleotide-binding universal stress UspA family protein
VASYTSILVGTDGSETSFKAVQRAAAIAADAGAVLVLVCAYRPLPERERARAADQLGDLAYKVNGSHPAEDILTEAEALSRSMGVKNIDRVALEGDPVDLIVETAVRKKCDLVVVGNRGLNSLSGRLLGSVPQNVSHKAHADVLIVHTTGR